MFEIVDQCPGRLYRSRHGVEQGVDQTPLIVFGHAADALAEAISGLSTLNVVVLTQLADLEIWLARHECVGIIAQSRPDAMGEAGEALGIVRHHAPSKARFYFAWDYNVARGATRAIEYSAHAVIMPAIEFNELFPLVFGVLAGVTAESAVPATIEEHRAILERYAPRSKFWEVQDLVVSRYY